MRKFLVTFIISLLFHVLAQAGAGMPFYTYALDLTKVADGKLLVELRIPKLDVSEVVYHIPKIVPGTYEIYDFGRFISSFKATDDQGADMRVVHTDTNSWKITNATHLSKITYRVENSWHSSAGLPIVFEPAGTNIEDGKNFVLNNHGFFGFFEGMKKLVYELDITKPAGFYGSTSLMDVHTVAGNTDVYLVPDYMKLVDAPIMYCKPDTTTVTVGAAKILISSYSPNHVVSSAYIAENIAQILKAQKEYLGGKLPIDKYAFIFYFCEKATLSGNSGALEHNLSSFYVLPEIKEEYLRQTLRDVAAHEFFHVVTPLAIHSEEIADFDFMVPHMSEHLWLYEGMTEYSAGLVQIKYGIIDLDAYVGMIHDKIIGASKFKDTLPITVMSRHVVEKEYHDQYNNVYQKGALIGMCLDMKLRKLSGGRYGIQEMLQDLSKTYGKDRAFKDDELFDAIVKLTYPEIGEFFRKYVYGPYPLPFKEMLGYAGIDFKAETTTKGITLGSFDLGYDEQQKHFIVAGTAQLDKFGKKMKYKKGDQIIAFNETALTLENAQELILKYVMNSKPGDELKVQVLRPGRKGVMKNKMLHAKLIEVETRETNVLVPDAIDQLTADQQQFRKVWINQ
jgi:predicted metalloprotease with PDZ domain